MSSAASISAAKKRRANQVQPMPPSQQMQQMQQQIPQIQRPMTAPSLANLSPAQRQQVMMQQQQRNMMQQQQQQQQQRNNNTQSNNSQNKNQTQTLTWPAPPIYLMKQMDTMLFQQSQSIDEIKNRLNCIETGSLSESELSELDLEQIKPALMADDEFLAGIVDNIMTNSNLSEIIEQIDIVQTENRELRELFYAQQKTINEMNIMLLKVFSQGISSIASVSIVSDASVSDAVSSEEHEEEPEEDGPETIQLETSDMQVVD